jgi:hypothetical protein
LLLANQIHFFSFWLLELVSGSWNWFLAPGTGFSHPGTGFSHPGTGFWLLELVSRILELVSGSWNWFLAPDDV